MIEKGYAFMKKLNFQCSKMREDNDGKKMRQFIQMSWSRSTMIQIMDITTPMQLIAEEGINKTFARKSRF